MKRYFLLVIIATLTTFSLSAQNIELIGRFAWMTTDADQEIEGTSDVNPARFEVSNDTGWGAALNVYWTDHISTEIGASWVEPDSIVTEISDVRAVLQNAPTTILPITAVIQYHFSPDGPWELYLGAGGAWVLFDDAINDVTDIELDDIDRIEFDNDAGLVANLGINVKLADNIGVNIDAKYVPLEAATTVVFGSGESSDSTNISFNPLIVSLGFSWRF